MRYRIAKCALACAFFFTALAPAGRASTMDLSWTGGSGTVDWKNPANWSGGTFFPKNTPGLSFNAIFPGTNDQATIGVGGPDSIAINSFDVGAATNHLFVIGGSNFTTDVLKGSGLVGLEGSAVTLRDASAFAGTLQLSSRGSVTALQLQDGALLNGNIQFAPHVPGSMLDPLSEITGVSGTESATNLGIITASNGSIGNMNVFTNHGHIETVTQPGFPSGFEIASYKFDNTGGDIRVAAGAPLQIASPHFLNYDGDTLKGGSYELHGAMIVAGPALTTIGVGTDVSIYNGGAITNGATNLLTQLNTNEGTLSLFEAGNNLTLSSPVLVNAGFISVATGAQLSTGVIQNNPGRTILVGAGSTLNGTGMLNNGILTADGLVNLRAGVTDSFQNVDAATETLTGGTITLSPTATMSYDAGSGAHGGAILHIADGTSLSLARGGQLQYGVTANDALAVLTSNAGLLTLAGGTHSFLPEGGTFSNDTTGVLTLSGGAFGRVYGDMTNAGHIAVFSGNLTTNNFSNSGTLIVQTDGEAVPADATVFGTLENSGQLLVGRDVSSTIDTVMATDVLNDGGDITIAADGLLQATNTFTQTAGTTTLTGGFLQAPAISLDGGSLSGNGELLGDVDNSGGTLSPTGGNVLVSGSYTQGAGGTLEEGLGSSYLFVDGDADLNGIFRGLDDPGGMPFVAGESFEILHFGGALTGNFSSFDLPTLAGLMFTEDIEAHDIRLVVSGASGTAAPEPSFMWLGGGMLALMGWRRSRRAR